MVKYTVVIVEMLLQHTAQAQVIMNVVQHIQVARSMLTVLPFAVRDANKFMNLFFFSSVHNAVLIGKW